MRLRRLPLSRVKQGHRVFLRIDGNFPLDKMGRLARGADWRLKHVLPYITQLCGRGAIVILCSHQRGKGKQASLKVVSQWFEKYSNLPVQMAPGTVGARVRSMIDSAKAGDLIVLENPRNQWQEEKNNAAFAKELASMADIYVNNAFGTSHRKHASIHAITRYLPSYAGPDVVREVRALSAKMRKPFTLVMGGIKLKTKLPVIEKLAPSTKFILTGGGIAITLLAARDKREFCLLGKKINDAELRLARRVLKRYSEKIILPVDFVVERGKKQSIWTDEIHFDDRIIDIGKRTREQYAQYMFRSKSVMWNGTMGIVEERGGEKGTLAISSAMQERRRAKTIVGGGDTIGFLHKKNQHENFTHLSTGGGAMLVFLAGGAMPGLEVLKK